jgi:hypothetical protein
MTIQSIEAELRRVERRGEELRKKLEHGKRKQFTSIPAKYGFKSMDAFIAALGPYASPRLRSRIGDESAGNERRARPQTPIKTIRRANTKYTDQHKAAVKAALTKGDKTVREIAQQTGVSEYVIIDWKKAWGLVKHRKAKGKSAVKKK